MEGRDTASWCLYSNIKFWGFTSQFQLPHLMVCAPNCKVERREVQNELGTVGGLMDRPWAICGDFNMCKFSSEKKRKCQRSSSMIEFSDLLRPRTYRFATWSWSANTGQGRCTYNIQNRPDTFHFWLEWSSQHETAFQIITSYHVSVALFCRPWKHSESHFKFHWRCGATWS